MYKKQNNYDGTENTDVIIRKSDGATIPVDNDNTDYQEYLEWAKTNTIEEAE